MTTKYDRLVTLALRLSPDMAKGSAGETFSAARVPTLWYEQAYFLNGYCKRDKNQFRQPPIGTLNKALLASARGIVGTASKAWQVPGRHWIYSRQALGESGTVAIKLALKAWAKRSFRQVPQPLLDEAIGQMLAQNLDWETVAFDPLEFDVCENGTANLPDPSFLLTPNLIALKLTQPDAVFDFGHKELRFIRAPMEGHGVELIEWPPRIYEGNFYSTLVTLTAQTVPFQSYPVVHCDVGIRRWVSSEHARLPWKENTTVYLLDRTGTTLDRPPCFQVAGIRLAHVDSEWTWVWDDVLIDLLAEIDPWRTYATPKELVENPNVGFDKELSAAIVYSEGMEPQHDVGPGWMPIDRYALMKQIMPKLLGWEQVELSRLTRPISRFAFPDSPFFDKWQDDSDKQRIIVARRQAIAKATGGQLKLEIRHQANETRDMLVEKICDYLGMEPSAQYAWQTPELNVEMRIEPLGALGESLALDMGIKRWDERRLRAVRDRAAKVADTIKSVNEAVVSIVEIASKKAYERDKDSDPYTALRLGFALTGRLAQFIVVDEGSLQDRAKAAFLDALRQLGVLIELGGASSEDIPAGTNYAGFWLVKNYQIGGSARRRAWLPVCVLIRPESGQVLATAPGLNGWLPYRQALQAMAQCEAHGCESDGEVTRFIEQVLRTFGDTNTLLMFHAQNFRNTWKWLQNSRITQDALAFVDAVDTTGSSEKTSFPISNWPGLRVVRVRDSSQRETPQWYAAGESEDYGLTRGVFEMGERVFASVQDKPRQMKNLSIERSKVDRWSTRTKRDETREPRPGTYAWNPNILELMVACVQDGDNPLAWAELTHNLRDAAVHYSEATSLPLPLHLAKLITQYVVSPEE